MPPRWVSQVRKCPLSLWKGRRNAIFTRQTFYILQWGSSKTIDDMPDISKTIWNHVPLEPVLGNTMQNHAIFSCQTFYILQQRSSEAWSRIVGLSRLLKSPIALDLLSLLSVEGCFLPCKYERGLGVRQKSRQNALWFYYGGQWCTLRIPLGLVTMYIERIQ